MIVMLAVVLLFFVRFDHFVTGFGDHFWVLLRDTVLLVNVILYLIACLIFLMVLVIFSLVLLSGQRIILWLVLLIVCLMIACILAALVHRSIASVVMVASMLWKSCLVRFVSLFFINCFDVACLLCLWRSSRVFRSALSVVCVLCLISAITACVLESLHFCFMRGRSWDVCWCVCCVANNLSDDCLYFGGSCA